MTSPPVPAGIVITSYSIHYTKLYDACAFVTVDLPAVLAGLDVGMPVTLSDGMLQFTVEQVVEKDRVFLLRARNSGILTSSYNFV